MIDTEFRLKDVDFDKSNGLVPAIIQDSLTREILMLGYMNQAALEATQQSGQVTFFSRSRQKLWVKGETSGNRLIANNIRLDCDQDSLLIDARPSGPICHLGSQTCFGEEHLSPAWLAGLENVIAMRQANKDPNSYSWKILSGGAKAAAIKFGEEASELQIAAVSESENRVTEEAADALYHMLLILAARNIDLGEVIHELANRARLKVEI